MLWATDPIATARAMARKARQRRAREIRELPPRAPASTSSNAEALPVSNHHIDVLAAKTGTINRIDGERQHAARAAGRRPQKRPTPSTTA